MGALLLVAGIPGCEMATAPAADGTCISGGARINGLYYGRTARLYTGPAFVPGDSVAVITRHRGCQDEAEVPEPWADGDANFLEPGTPIFAVPGYPPYERLVAEVDSGWIELEPMDPITGFIEETIQVLLTLDAPRVSTTGALTARLLYRVSGTDTTTLTSGYGCLAFTGVYRDTTRIPVPATDYYCTAAITSWPLTAGDPITETWTLPLGPDGTPLDPGTYRFVAELNTHSGRTLELEFQVR